MDFNTLVSEAAKSDPENRKLLDLLGNPLKFIFTARRYGVGGFFRFWSTVGIFVAVNGYYAYRVFRFVYIGDHRFALVFKLSLITAVFFVLYAAFKAYKKFPFEVLLTIHRNIKFKKENEEKTDPSKEYWKEDHSTEKKDLTKDPVIEKYGGIKSLFKIPQRRLNINLKFGSEAPILEQEMRKNQNGFNLDQMHNTLDEMMTLESARPRHKPWIWRALLLNFILQFIFTSAIAF